MAQEMAVRNNETHTMAILSVVLGILGVVGILPVIGSVGAIITGNMALNEIAQSGAYSGADLAKVGRVLGWVGVGLMAFGLAIFLMIVFLFAIPFSMEFGMLMVGLV